MNARAHTDNAHTDNANIGPQSGRKSNWRCMMTNAIDGTTATTWDIDPTHTEVGFSVKHMMITTVRGDFSGVSGKLELDPSDPTSSSVDVTIDASTIHTGVEDRDNHLRSGDFLDVDAHPQIRFRSTRIDGTFTEPGDTFRITGDLTIRGITREVTLDAQYEGRGGDPWGSERVGFTAEIVIDRRDFGLAWNTALETGGILVANQVRISLAVQAVLQPESAVA